MDDLGASVAFGFPLLGDGASMFSVSSTVMISTLLTLIPQVSVRVSRML